MTRLGHDPIEILGHDRTRVMTQKIISVMTATGHDPSLGQWPGSTLYFSRRKLLLKNIIHMCWIRPEYLYIITRFQRLDLNVQKLK
jgi:hypothetical protein